jgi:ketosteroid isomerase-like protein
MPITLDGLAGWMEQYVAAWRSNDRAAIESLFTDDARYFAEPYDQPYLGAAAIADAWLGDLDEPNTWRADYAPVLVAGDRGVAAGTSTYLGPDGAVQKVFHNVFVLTFAAGDDALRCAEYREWYMREPKAKG